jgi:prepilin-type N-terminal cleavage/methylation domain-containing protein
MRILNDRGLTLAEILVAVAIIGLALAGLAAVVPIASYGVQEGNQLSTATFLADQRIEQVRNATWTLSPPADCVGVSPGGAAPTGAATSNTCDRPADGTTGLAACATGAACATYPDEAAGVAGFTGYTRTTRVIDCGAGAGCAGVVNVAMRAVRVTVTYRPLTSGGVSPANKTVTVDWLVAQR